MPGTRHVSTTLGGDREVEEGHGLTGGPPSGAGSCRARPHNPSRASAFPPSSPHEPSPAAVQAAAHNARSPSSASPSP